MKTFGRKLVKIRLLPLNRQVRVKILDPNLPILVPLCKILEKQEKNTSVIKRKPKETGVHSLKILNKLPISKIRKFLRLKILNKLLIKSKLK